MFGRHFRATPLCDRRLVGTADLFSSGGRAIWFELQAGLWLEVAEGVTSQTLTPSPVSL
jgi:hypothetical protein